MNRVARQHGFVLLPVVLAITLVAVIAFMLNNQGTVNVDVTAGVTDSVRADQVARAGLAHANWGAQNSGCSGDMTMNTVSFGQAGTDYYSATIKTPGGTTTAHPDLVSDQDAWFRSDNITTNNGTANTYHLRKESGALEYAVVRFDLSALPAGAQINSATARFYVKGGKGHPEGPVTVHRVTADWTETDATWETHGDKFDSAVLATIPAQPVDGDAWVEINLTAQVQAWVNSGEPSYGIMLIPAGEGTHAEYISREGAASEQPRLDVIVGNGAASPAILTANGTLAGNPSPANDITRALERTAVPAYQPTSVLAFQPGPEGKDAMIYQWKPDWNYGVNQGLDVLGSTSEDSDYHSLLQFNLGKIPYGAKIHSAQLALYQNNNGAWGGPVGVRRITSGWGEGSGTGGIAAGVTWNNSVTGIPWSTPGGDFGTTAFASTTIPAGTKDWFSWDITGLVAGWVSGTYPNHGLALVPESVSTNAYFNSSDATDPALRPKLTLTYACECGTPCIAPQGSGTVLMVVSDDTNPTPEDTHKRALFESWGYSVIMRNDNSSLSSFNADMTNSDVVFISDSVDPATLAGKLASAPIGIVNEEGGMLSDLGMGGLFGTAIGPSINVVDTSHYITALFPAGPLDIYSADMELQGIFNTPAPGLQSLANYGTSPLLAVLETGADLKGGGTAAGRRVMLPFGRDANKNWDYINANGLLILQRALQWGTGNTGAAPPPPKNLLFVAASTIPTAPEQLRIDLIESWGYTVTLIDDNHSQANFDAAVAANDVAYVASTVSDTALGTKLTASPVGVVNELATLAEEFGIAQESVGYKSRIEIDVLDDTHYITQP
ncbi:MAG: DNRLRE domain-containing protein, partial [Gammaproteobacteria bacterium]|nr:DNRLRE domain-containing protein [Gammaproteobacteria bacterium]